MILIWELEIADDPREPVGSRDPGNHAKSYKADMVLPPIRVPAGLSPTQEEIAQAKGDLEYYDSDAYHHASLMLSQAQICWRTMNTPLWLPARVASQGRHLSAWFVLWLSTLLAETRIFLGK